MHRVQLIVVKYLAKKSVEWEPKSALNEGYHREGHRISCRHDGVILPSQPQIDVGRDVKLTPKVIELGRGVYPMLPHTHNIGFT